MMFITILFSINPVWCLPFQVSFGIPKILDCSGTLWEEFLREFQTNALNGHPFNSDLLSTAQERVSKWEHQEYPPYHFFSALCWGDHHSWDGNKDVVSSEGNSQDTFCLYGFVSALFVRARHLMELDDDTLRAVAYNDLYYAAVLLGKELAIDHMHSSQWPLSSMDILINLNSSENGHRNCFIDNITTDKKCEHLKRSESDTGVFGFQTYEEYISVGTLPPPIFSQLNTPYEEIELAEWATINTIHHSNFTANRIGNTSYKDSQRHSEMVLNIAAIGTHATLTLEPVYQLQRQVELMRQRNSHNHLPGSTFSSEVPKLKFRFYGIDPSFCDRDKIFCFEDGLHREKSIEVTKMIRKVANSPHDSNWQERKSMVFNICTSSSNMDSGNGEVSLSQPCNAEVIICTEPLMLCLLIMEIQEEVTGKIPSLIGYFGVSLLNHIPLNDVENFWLSFNRYITQTTNDAISYSLRPDVMIAANNPILKEQILYQTGLDLPIITPLGLYTNTKYRGTHRQSGYIRILIWRSILYVYETFECLLLRYLEINFREIDGVHYFRSHRDGATNEWNCIINSGNDLSRGVQFTFLKEGETITYENISDFTAVILLPWDHAQMTLYELHSIGIPIFVPDDPWLYRMIYQRGQLTVGERVYQTVREGHTPYPVRFIRSNSEHQDLTSKSSHLVEQLSLEDFTETSSLTVGTISAIKPIHVEDPREDEGDESVISKLKSGVRAAVTARFVAEDIIGKAIESFGNRDYNKAEMFTRLVVDLLKDMKYFHSVALDELDTKDTYSSVGVIRRGSNKPRSGSIYGIPTRDNLIRHPYSPFDISPSDSYDFTRMRKGIWWLRRGHTFDALRYWHQYSDFHQFQALQRFRSIPDLLCKLFNLKPNAVSAEMRSFQMRTSFRSNQFWFKAATLIMTDEPWIISQM